MSEPIRVAHIIGKLNAAGVEAVINNYYRNIDRDKYQFDFFIDEDSNCQPPEELKALGARYYVIPPYQKLHRYLPTLVKLFRQNKYQIVHSSMNTLSVFPLFAAWLAGVPVRINHNHNTAAKGETARNIMKAVLKPFAKIFATDYCGCSDKAAIWLFGKRCFEKGKVTVFNNAIDLEKFKYDPQIGLEKKRELGLEGKFVVGHVGRFCFQKNHEYLVRIFREVSEQKPDAVLLLVGIGELMDDVKAKVSELGIADRVIFLGARADMAQLYQAMDVFVLPSRYEGLPVVAVEAQASGVPCLVSEAVTPEVVMSSVIELLSIEQEPGVWAKKILSKVEYERHDVSAEVRASGFDIRTEAKKLENYYSERI